MLLGGRNDTETRISARIPRTMMAAVAYATEFGGGSTTPAYKAKWLYSLASNRNDSALKFSETWPYIEVPDRKRVISEPFKDQLTDFTGIIINETKESDGYKYNVTFQEKSETQQQFFLAFFVMRLCYTKAARDIAKYNKSEPETGKSNGGFINDQEDHAEKIEKIFDAFYHGAVAADNKEALPVGPLIRRYFRENLAGPMPATNEKLRLFLAFVRKLGRHVSESVISSTRRMMSGMIIVINSALGSIHDNREHDRAEAESIAESPRSSSKKRNKRANADPGKKAASERKKKKAVSKTATEENSDTSKTPVAADDVNIALVNVDKKHTSALISAHIIQKGRYYNATDLESLRQKSNALIVQLHQNSDIDHYIRWQEENGADRIAIFFDTGAHFWDDVSQYKGDQYRLFYAGSDDAGYLYCLTSNKNRDFDLSYVINTKLSIEEGVITWTEDASDHEDNEETPFYHDPPYQKGQEAIVHSSTQLGVNENVNKREEKAKKEDAKQAYQEKPSPVKPQAGAEKVVGGAEEDPINQIDPIVEDAIKQVVNKTAGDAGYETTNKLKHEIGSDVRLIFVVLPHTTQEDTPGKKNDTKKQTDIKKYLDTFLKWQGGKKDRLAVFVASNGDPDAQYFIEYAKEKDSNVLVHTNDNVNMKMYCIVNVTDVNHEYVDGAKWTQVVSEESERLEIVPSEDAKGTDADVLVVGAKNADVTQHLFRRDASYTAKAKQERSGAYNNKVVVMVGCTGKDSISSDVEAVLVTCSNPEQWKKELDCLKKLCKPTKENKNKYVFWIGRGDEKVVLLAKKGSDYELKNEAGGLGLSYDKWGMLSEISFIDETKTTTNLELLNTSKAKEEYKYEVHIPPPSYEVIRVRSSGIQCAVDYITATKSNAECAMAGLRSAVMTDIQRLVYLTLDQEAPVRIFALATGSGKTRCIGLALYSAIAQHGIGEPVCMVMKKGTAQMQLVNEIMTGMYVNESSNGITKQIFIAEHISTGNKPILSVFGGLLNGYEKYKSGGDSAEEQQEMENGSFEKVCGVLSEKFNVHVVFLEDLDSEDKQDKAKKDAIEILSKCKVVIADECNNVLPHMSEMAKCENFIGFSATPFGKEEEITGLMEWSNQRKGGKNINEERYEEFIRNNVVYVSEDDVLSILPYADRQFDILYAELKSDATKDVYYDMTIDIEKETQETADGRSSVKKTIESLPFKDREAEFTKEEYDTAMTKVLDTLLENRKKGVFRSLVIIPSSSTYATKFMEKVEASADLVAIKATDDNWEEKYYTALGEKPENAIVLADFQKSTTSTSTKSALRGYPAKVRDETFNALNDDGEAKSGRTPGKHKSFLAMVTDEWDGVEYHGVSNTYIINTPLDKRKCEQARNRAFRMCSHDREAGETDPKKPKTHKIWYVVVERPLDGGMTATRGAYAIANAHPAPEEKKLRVTTLLSGAVRFQYDKKNTTKVFGKIARSSWFHDQSDDVRQLCNAERAAAYMNSLKGDFSVLHEGAVTVLDLAAHLASTALRIQTHDGRIETMIKVISSGKSSTSTAVKFDNGEYPVPFHHTLRGICFDLLDKEPEYEKGDLALRYTAKHGPIISDPHQSVVVKSIGDLATGHVIEDAQASYHVCTGVQRAFYVGAHRVQCTGHARFECFRVFGPDEAGVKLKRSFVGTEDQFNAFIETLASGDNHRGICRHDEKSTTRVTPMMVAAWIRRSLFRRRSVTVGYNEEKAAHTKLKEYLERELLIGEWKENLVIFNNNNTLQTDIEIKVDGAAAATRVVYEPETIFTQSKQSTQKQKGALYIFDNKDEFDQAKSLWVLPPADKFPTVNIRGMKPFKTKIGDTHCVRCDTATYVCEKTDATHVTIERVVTNDGTIGLISNYADDEPARASSSKANAAKKKP